MRKTIIIPLLCAAVTALVAHGCADKRKIEPKAAAPAVEAAEPQTIDETDGADEDMSASCHNAKIHGLECKRNAEGRLECLDAENIRLLAAGVPEKGRDTWYRFFVGDDDTCVAIAGFKDKNGATRLKAKDFLRGGVYNLLYRTNRFDDIIIANGCYYTRAGKKVGRDSVIYSLAPECCHDLNCESEGFIIFEDEKHDKQGMFNRNGDVAVPAEYSYLSRVLNGMIIARKGAVRKRDAPVRGADGSIRRSLEDCGGKERCYWAGGTWPLIDTLNNVLVEDIGSDAKLNLFSVQKTEKPHPDTALRESFPAKGGGYYSFISYKKEFTYWLTRDLLKDLTVEKLITATSDSLKYETALGYISKTSRNKRAFVTDNFTSLERVLADILEPKLKIDISTVPFEVEFSEFFDLAPEKYHDNCGNHKDWIYPAMMVDIEYKNYKRNHVIFLRTDDGYKLIGVKIKNDDGFRPAD